MNNKIHLNGNFPAHLFCLVNENSTIFFGDVLSLVNLIENLFTRQNILKLSIVKTTTSGYWSERGKISPTVQNKFLQTRCQPIRM